MVGGYISIALVYEDNNESSNKLEGLIKYFTQNGSIPLEMKYCEDEEGEIWREEILCNKTIDFTLLTEGYFGSIIVNTDIFNGNLIKINISVHKEKGCFGFLIDIEWEDLFKECSKSLSDEVSANIVNFLHQIYLMTHYNYSYCGHEVEVECSSRDLKSKVNQYPIAVVPFEDRLEVFYGEFSIDGVSLQNKGKQIYSID